MGKQYYYYYSYYQRIWNYWKTFRGVSKAIVVLTAAPIPGMTYIVLESSVSSSSSNDNNDNNNNNNNDREPSRISNTFTTNTNDSSNDNHDPDWKNTTWNPFVIKNTNYDRPYYNNTIVSLEGQQQEQNQRSSSSSSSSIGTSKNVISDNDNNSNNESGSSSSIIRRRTTSRIGPWMDNIASLPCLTVVSDGTASIPVAETTSQQQQQQSNNTCSTTTHDETTTKTTTTKRNTLQREGTTTNLNSESITTIAEKDDAADEEGNAVLLSSVTRRYISRWGNNNNYNQKQQPSSSLLPSQQQQQQQQHKSSSTHPTIIDEYPNFTRHRNDFLLKQYLTPQLYQDLASKYYKNDDNGCEESIDDIIKGGVALPYGGMYPMPHNSVAGIYIGYPSSYTAYRDLLIPIIQSYHYSSSSTTIKPQLSQRRGIVSSSAASTATTTTTNKRSSSTMLLQRHETNLNPKQLIQKRLDDDGRYILYTRMRLARSINGFPFPTKMNRSTRRQIEQILIDCSQDWTKNNNETTAVESGSDDGGGYKSIVDMSNHEHEELIRRHVVFANPDDYLNLVGLGNDWPDGRGIYCDTWSNEYDIPAVMIWCNAYDHYWIISHAKGGNVQEVFTRLSETVTTFERSLQQRNYTFVEDPVLGYLNSSPADIGTALRASVLIKLVRLGQLPGFYDIVCPALHIHARPQGMNRANPRYSGIFHISNIESYGKTEVELINIMITGVAKCIELEQRLENGEIIDLYKLQL